MTRTETKSTAIILFVQPCKLAFKTSLLQKHCQPRLPVGRICRCNRSVECSRLRPLCTGPVGAAHQAVPLLRLRGGDQGQGLHGQDSLRGQHSL
jgi:hypothetical protein